MPSLAEHSSGQFVKLLYIGDSGTGKTGSLVSLVKAGYRIRFLDLDNGLTALVQQIRQQCPEKLGAVDYETVRDKYKASPGGPIVSGMPKAFTRSLELMMKWTDDSDPSQWGSDTIFVLDSLSAFGKAAFEWAKGMNPTAKDPRQWYGAAQEGMEKTIMLLTGEAFATNLIIISHVNYRENALDGTVKGYANSIGSALGPTIPKYFDTLVLAESSGSGANVKRKIKTVPTGTIDLKAPVPGLPLELPLNEGMATLFESIKNGIN